MDDLLLMLSKEEDVVISSSAARLKEFLEDSVWKDLEKMLYGLIHSARGELEHMKGAGSEDFVGRVAFHQGICYATRYFIDLPSTLVSEKELDKIQDEEEEERQ